MNTYLKFEMPIQDYWLSFLKCLNQHNALRIVNSQC